MRRYREIDPLRADHSRLHEAIRVRLAEFAAVPPDGWWMELAYCLLTPQSSARSAALAIDALRRAGFPERWGAGEAEDGTAEDRGAATGGAGAQETQNRPPDPSPLLKGDGYYIRFHHTKARRLLEAAARQKEIVRVVAAARGTDGRELRTWLVRNVRGLGWKEASHFLRNIGYRDLAILDRHILRNLRRHGVIRTVPAALTAKRYLAIERAFLTFARTISIPMDELDLLFWSRETGEILK